MLLGMSTRAAGHDEAGLDGVNGPFRRDAADAVGDEAHVDRRGRNRPAGAGQVAGSHRYTAQILQGDQGQRQRFVLAGKRLARERLSDLVMERRIVVVDVLHVVAVENHVAAATVFVGRLQGIARRAMEDPLEVVVEVEAAFGFHVLEEFLPLLGFFDGKDHYRRHAAREILSLEVDPELPVRHVDFERLFMEVCLLVLVERVVGRQVLDIPEAKVFLLAGVEVHRLGDDRLSLSQDGPFPVDLILPPESRGIVDVHQHAVAAVRHVDRQPARLDADVILVERIRLQGVEAPKDFRVFQAEAAPLAVECAFSNLGESLHHRAGAQTEVKGVEPVEGHSAGRIVAFEAEVVHVHRGRRLLVNAENQLRDAA